MASDPISEEEIDAMEHCNVCDGGGYSEGVKCYHCRGSGQLRVNRTALAELIRKREEAAISRYFDEHVCSATTHDDDDSLCPDAGEAIGQYIESLTHAELAEMLRQRKTLTLREYVERTTEVDLLEWLQANEPEAIVEAYEEEGLVNPFAKGGE